MAVWLAEGKRVRDMAKATGHTDAAIYWHLQRIYQKHSLTAVSRKEHRPEGQRQTPLAVTLTGSALFPPTFIDAMHPTRS